MPSKFNLSSITQPQTQASQPLTVDSILAMPGAKGATKADAQAILKAYNAAGPGAKAAIRKRLKGNAGTAAAKAAATRAKAKGSGKAKAKVIEEAQLARLRRAGSGKAKA